MSPRLRAFLTGALIAAAAGVAIIVIPPALRAVEGASADSALPVVTQPFFAMVLALVVFRKVIPAMHEVIGSVSDAQRERERMEVQISAMTQALDEASRALQREVELSRAALRRERDR